MCDHCYYCSLFAGFSSILFSQSYQSCFLNLINLFSKLQLVTIEWLLFDNCVTIVFIVHCFLVSGLQNQKP